MITGDSAIGFAVESQTNGVSLEETVTPYLDALSNYRVAVRRAARAGDVQGVLQATDDIRDEILPRLGVRLEDKGTGAEVTSIWKLTDPAVLEAERVSCLCVCACIPLNNLILRLNSVRKKRPRN